MATTTMPPQKAEHLRQLQELSKKSVAEQCKTFLRAFVADFQGNFEGVLALADEFTAACATPTSTDMDEHTAHMFLEKRGEAHTVVELRDKLRQIDLDCNQRMSFAEFALFKYKKPLSGLFDTEAVPRALIVALEKAIEKYESVQKAKADKAQRIAELEREVAAGGAGAPRAKAELRRLQMDDPGKSGADEISAMAERMKAKAALRNPGEEARRLQEEQYREEQARVEAEAKRKADEERAAKEASRQRLKDRAKLWQ